MIVFLYMSAIILFSFNCSLSQTNKHVNLTINKYNISDSLAQFEFCIENITDSTLNITPFDNGTSFYSYIPQNSDAESKRFRLHKSHFPIHPYSDSLLNLSHDEMEEWYLSKLLTLNYLVFLDPGKKICHTVDIRGDLNYNISLMKCNRIIFGYDTERFLYLKIGLLQYDFGIDFVKDEIVVFLPFN